MSDLLSKIEKAMESGKSYNSKYGTTGHFKRHQEEPKDSFTRSENINKFNLIIQRQRTNSVGYIADIKSEKSPIKKKNFLITSIVCLLVVLTGWMCFQVGMSASSLQSGWNSVMESTFYQNLAIKNGGINLKDHCEGPGRVNIQGREACLVWK